MIIGRVVGRVWATRKDRRLQHHKLLLIRPYFYYAPTHEAEQLVAVDTLDAGIGDDVVVCLGAPARWSLGSGNLPLDAAVLAVVDRCQLARAAFSGRRPLVSLGRRLPVGLEWL
jgi:ethanolamine utilization protein EutN